jgi:tetraprenyl-beta-curcumene synthase
VLAREIASAAARVLMDHRRLRFLLRGGLGDAFALERFFAGVLPLAHASLADLGILARQIPDDALRSHALTTLDQKAYHVAGAGILATFLPRAARRHYMEIVAPLESIYDFLDTVCDRGEVDERASRQLHQALFDALDPARKPAVYFLYGPPGESGGYLQALVRRVRDALGRVPDYELLVPRFAQAAQLYADTQTYKHLAAGERQRACMQWYADSSGTRGLSWWEYAAAAGSQFHVYGPLYAAFRGRPDTIDRTYEAYFPEFAALHVLLDSFIDQAEDRTHGELNWFDCYESMQAFTARMRVLAARARSRLDRLPDPGAHRFALRIMVLFYLSHPKVAQQQLDVQAAELLAALQ